MSCSCVSSQSDTAKGWIFDPHVERDYGHCNHAPGTGVHRYLERNLKGRCQQGQLLIFTGRGVQTVHSIFIPATKAVAVVCQHGENGWSAQQNILNDHNRKSLQACQTRTSLL